MPDEKTNSTGTAGVSTPSTGTASSTAAAAGGAATTTTAAAASAGTYASDTAALQEMIVNNDPDLILCLDKGERERASRARRCDNPV
ncbi:hypothetical protein V2A60_004824 [Cordyceps javanica]|uniref:Uncharacterized protein n=1 Tax=Cordyceps javanica TaxID=43265 RepID=A0A545VC83_9HYPO|nr:hypothetical protein IF1G_01562 [Cordyceps javanica]TQW10974.1 hypothetical protein IF2G_01916 [Cordyceps javanica]